MSFNLTNETSLYLKEYSKTPVDWYAWQEEAFQKAKEEKRPIFISIGYSTSHWCKVMKEESFNDETIAKLLNQNFISIKVDKDERPDIDKYYKNIYRLMNGQNCASPNNIFLTENLEPFYTAAYIAPYPKGNVLGFQELLNIIIDKYSNDKETMIQKGQEVLEYINPQNQKIEATKLSINILNTITTHANELTDKEHGGFGDAPKFPHTSTLDLLLDCYELTQNRELLDLVLFTLKKMAKGSIYDKINGGFYRYVEDKAWSHPHIEKMTYDNANLSAVYLRAYQITGESFYKKIAFETIDFMLNSMSEQQLFYANSKDDFIDKKIITSWNAMMIDTLFLATTIEPKYKVFAIASLERLLEKFYIDGELYHTSNTKAFLEDYAYLGVALLNAYLVTDNEEYLLLSQSILNQAIEQFYEHGRWKFSNSEFILYDDGYDLTYPSAMATIIYLMQKLSPYVEGDYSELIFKTLEINSYNLMRQPLSTPKMTKGLLLYLKNDIIATK